MSRPGRPNIYVTWNGLPGKWLVRDAAKETGLTYEAISSGLKRGRPVGPRKLMFTRVVELPRIASVDADDAIDLMFENAYARNEDERKSIMQGSVDGETLCVLGMELASHDDGKLWFEDVEGIVYSAVALMLDRNPLRDELFSACREVMPRLNQ